MSSPPKVTLTSEEVQCAARLSTIFAQYGTADTLSSRESNMLAVLGEFALSRRAYSTAISRFENRRP